MTVRRTNRHRIMVTESWASEARITLLAACGSVRQTRNLPASRRLRKNDSVSMILLLGRSLRDELIAEPVPGANARERRSAAVWNRTFWAALPRMAQLTRSAEL
jgi:hypothetical protein